MGGLGIKWLNFYPMLHATRDFCLSSWIFASTVWVLLTIFRVCSTDSNFPFHFCAPPIIVLVVLTIFRACSRDPIISCYIHAPSIVFQVVLMIFRVCLRDPCISFVVRAPLIAIWVVFELFLHFKVLFKGSQCFLLCSCSSIILCVVLGFCSHSSGFVRGIP